MCATQSTVVDTKRRSEPPWVAYADVTGAITCVVLLKVPWVAANDGANRLRVAGADVMETAAVKAELLVTANKLYQWKDVGCAITYIVCTLALITICSLQWQRWR